jgi:hypothetical protein
MHSFVGLSWLVVQGVIVAVVVLAEVTIQDISFLTFPQSLNTV